MCVNWNELRYLIACASSESQPVATRLPGVRLPLETHITQQTRLCGARPKLWALDRECWLSIHPEKDWLERWIVYFTVLCDHPYKISVGGLYTSLFCVIIPTLFPYFLPFWYLYILHWLTCAMYNVNIQLNKFFLHFCEVFKWSVPVLLSPSTGKRKSMHCYP